jgi:hypothetical protein
MRVYRNRHPEKQKEAHSKWYGSHREVFLSSQKQKRRKFTEFIWRLKTAGYCTVCGLRDAPECLDFHHLFDKKFGINSTAAGRSRKEFLIEFEKCVLLCANCHRKLHAGTLTLEV